MQDVPESDRRGTIVAGAWRRDPDTLARLTPHSVVVSIDSAPAPVRVSGVAFAVWLCLTEALTTNDLVDKVSELCGATPAAFERAVLFALRELVELGAVVPR